MGVSIVYGGHYNYDNNVDDNSNGVDDNSNGVDDNSNGVDDDT